MTKNDFFNYEASDEVMGGCMVGNFCLDIQVCDVRYLNQIME